MSAPSLLVLALRDCVEAMTALEKCDAIRPPEDWWAAIRAARAELTAARTRAETTLAAFAKRTPSEW